jgi:SMC interacting uncharacterized protein involved in chromosome segregation
MKYYSETTKNFYDSEDECLAAEAELKAKLEQQMREKEEKLSKKKAHEDHLEELHAAAIEAQTAYRKALNSYLKDYGSFSRTYSSDETGDFLMSILEGIFNF